MHRLATRRNLRMAAFGKTRIEFSRTLLACPPDVPSLLNRYLAREVIGVLLVTGPALCLLVMLLQSMRLLPTVIAADLGPSDVLRLAAALSVPVIAVALPAAAVVTVLMVLARLEGDGELIALRSCGASSARLARAPVVVCAAVAVIAGLLSLYAEPIAYRSLEARLGALLLRSALGRVRPGVIVEIVPGLMVTADRRRGDLLERVVIEDGRRAPSTLLAAASATFEPVHGLPAARLIVEDGTVQSRTPSGVLTRASFARLEGTVDLSGAAGSATTVVPRRFGLSPSALHDVSLAGGDAGRDAALLLHRRLAVGPGAFVLCALALALALRRPITARPWAVTIGACLVLVFHLLSRLGEALVEANVLSPGGGAYLPVVVFCAALITMVVLRPRR